MRTFSWSRGPAKPLGGVAVLLPGAGYTVQAPLLSWSAALLVELGWHVQAVEWTMTDEARERPVAFVERAVEAAFADAPVTDRRLVVGKSLGAFALPWAVRHGVPGIWLTPVLTDPVVARALDDADASHLAAGGDRDTAWLPESAPSTAARLVTVPGGDHGLLVPGRWLASVEVQTALLQQVSEHVRTL
ncbi:hypothetical protein [Sanguibacter sp. 25GB23B1]|uniref:hypothetical protein n=1 Tax=unclassified Sanguibacter TaxID=2645534 RepID=UPI0032AEA4E1